MNLKARRLLATFGQLPAGATVVEIGCIRFQMELASDGFSTVYIAAWALARGWKFHSVDIDPLSIRRATTAVGELPVTLHHADGREWLTAFPGPIDALYLDGSVNPDEALAQYRAANLAAAAVVVVDDVQQIDECERGKGELLLDVLERDGFTVQTFDTEPRYQMAVAKRGTPISTPGEP